MAGATFMAAGSSGPELATAMIGVFVAKVSPFFRLSRSASSLYRQSHYREVERWEILMEQELRFGLDLGWFDNF